MQGAQNLRSEAYLAVRRNDEGEAQRRRWTFYEAIKSDDLVKSPFCPIFVIPAKAGIQLFQAVLDSCACPGPDPGFAGVTDFLTFNEFITLRRAKKKGHKVKSLCGPYQRKNF